MSRFASQIRMKRDRPKGTFYGNDQGRWGYDEGYPLDILQRWDWKASIGLSSTNGWRNLSVDGATEDNRGFRKALREIVREYPEVADYVVSFDGPFQPVTRLVGAPAKAPGAEVDLGRLTYFHGTSDDVLDEILLQGLKPRGATNVEPTYGVEVGASPSRAEAVYLTTQMGLASAAANSAARKRGGKPVILEITGLSHNLFQPDEDSGESDAVKSLERMGSVAYVGSIRPGKIRVRWDKMASAARVASRYAGTHRSLVRLTCDYRGDFFLMDLKDDLFIHFTPPERAEQILADGKLLMRPPYKKFGIDAVTAVSAVWGMWLPAVQTTHSKRDDLVAIAFRTNTVPMYGHPEEVVWDRDVVLRDARILPFSKAKAMLQAADDGKEKQVYYEVPSWCEAPR